jgi:Xaa-Pro aminopeptidase
VLYLHCKHKAHVNRLPHYTPTAQKSDPIDTNKMLVVDIGQQYFDATTDTTRTYHFNPKRATQAEKRAFTRVLQGNQLLSV